MRGVSFTAYQKRHALRLWLDEKMPVMKVCQKCKCTERSLWRWKAKYDGTLQSLENQFSRKDTIHPNQHTAEEVANITKVLSKPHMSYCEAYGILRDKYAYSRSFGGFYNYVLRHNIRPHKEIQKYIPQPYDTPEMLGVKWQMDVKYVPKECYKGEIIYGHENKYFQYTMIDEATRERFIYPYDEHTISATLDFIKRAIAYFGYLPSIMQTDNGLEFTNHKEKKWQNGTIITTKKVHAVDELLQKLHIKHQLIRAYTPRLNGKVERSHRTDQEFFYDYLKFKTFAELKKKMLDWNIRYNKKPHYSLRNREGKRVFWSPLQKREDLLALLEEKREEYCVRFIKQKRTMRQVYAA